MVRANIVTLYNSPNCGAYLQAFALGDVLRDMTGFAPRYVETGARLPKRGISSTAKSIIKKVGITFADVRRWSFAADKTLNFARALSSYEVIGIDYPFKSNDLLVFGSDEIWNLDRPDIANYPALWGSGITGGVRVSYAPSANGARLGSVSCAEDFRRSLADFSLISSRDCSTQEAVSELTSREVEVVCDPTLLMDVEKYRELQHDVDLHDYLLVYSYGKKMTDYDITAIRDFAGSKGLKVVSGGFNLPWCDVSLPIGPFELLGLMDNADYVVTDTFHGTVFASIYHKRFATYGRMNSKVIEFVMGYGLEDHMITEGRGLKECLERTDDFARFDACWKDAKRSSLDYLRRAVELCVSNDNAEANNCINVEKGVDLAPLTTFRMGGKAARFWKPKRGDDLCALPKGKSGYRVISAGSNLLVSERTFTDVVSMREFDDSIEGLGGGEYRVGASVRVQRLISKVNADGYGGIEAFVSVPAMVGGMICMNASVPSAKSCISDYLLSVEVFDGEKVVEVPKSDCAFGYRTSAFQDGHALVLGACFRFPKQDPVVSAAKVDARRKHVKQTQDKSAPNFGSVFCVSSARAMRLIRKKGLAVGGVGFSRKTGNWILNNGGSFADAIAVLGKAKRINGMFGTRAKLEVRVWK